MSWSFAFPFVWVINLISVIPSEERVHRQFPRRALPIIINPSMWMNNVTCRSRSLPVMRGSVQLNGVYPSIHASVHPSMSPEYNRILRKQRTAIKAKSAWNTFGIELGLWNICIKFNPWLTFWFNFKWACFWTDENSDVFVWMLDITRSSVFICNSSKGSTRFLTQRRFLFDTHVLQSRKPLPHLFSLTSEMRIRRTFTGSERAWLPQSTAPWSPEIHV